MGNLRRLKRKINGVKQEKRPGENAAEVGNFPEIGRHNAYRCDKCEQYTVVVHRDKGVTPSMLKCRATEDCTGMGFSIGYPPGPTPKKFILAAKFEWYRPEWEDPILKVPGMRDHVIAGGLALREIE